MARTPQLLAAILGIWRAGAYFVPIDPTFPQAEVERLLQSEPAIGVLCDEATVKLIRESAARVFILTQPTGDGFSIDLERPASGRRDQESCLLREATAYVIHTSGSTARPKGVAVSHASMMNYLEWACVRYQTDLGIGSVAHSSIAADLSITALLAPLLSGNCVSFVSSDEIEALAMWLRSNASTTPLSFLKLTPSGLELLARLMPQEELKRVARHFVLGGEELKASTLALAFGDQGHVSVTNEYGPTEATVGCVAHSFVMGAAPLPPRIPIGQPIWNTSVLLVPEEDAGEGETSAELVIHGAGVAEGYLGIPDAPAFVTSQSGLRGYRTGDAARVDSFGNLVYERRLGLETKIHGYRVDPEGIAARLGEMPGVQSAAVIVVEPPDGSRFLSAFVVCDETSEVDAPSVSTWARTHLVSYSRPDRIEILSAMPLSATQKVDRRALLERSLARRTAKPGARLPPAAAASSTFAAVAAAWSKVLETADPDPNDNFFAVGGDSIAALHFVNELGRQGLTLSVREVLNERTLARITAAARRTPSTRQGVTSPVVPRAVPLSALQGAVLETFESACRWNLFWTFTLAQRMDNASLLAVFRAVCDNHPALRTCLRVVDGVWRGECNSSAPPILDWCEASSPTSDPILELLARVGRLRKQLSVAGPVIGLCAVTSADETHCALVAQHLVCDVVSLQILARELSFACVHGTVETSTADNYLPWLADASKRPFARFPVWNKARPCDEHAGSLNAPTLTELPLRYPLRPYLTSAVIIHSFAKALEVWPGQCNAVCIEHNGRSGFEELDLTQTVGWLTSFHELSITGLGEQSDRVAAIEKFLSKPERCSGTIPSVAVNFLGRLRQSEFGPSITALDRLAGVPDGPALFTLELVCWIDAGRLQTLLRYPREEVRAEDAHGVSAAFVSALQSTLLLLNEAHHPSVHDPSLSPTDVAAIIEGFS